MQAIEAWYLKADISAKAINPQWEAETNEMIKQSFKSDPDVVISSDLNWIIVLMKINKMNALYLKHEQEFNQYFKHTQEPNQTMIDLDLNNIKYEFALYSLEGYLWELLKQMPGNDALYQNIWIDFKTYYEVLEQYAFKSDEIDQSINLNDIINKTKTKYQNHKITIDEIKQELNPLLDLETSELDSYIKETYKREILYAIIITKYIDELDSSINYKIKFK